MAYRDLEDIRDSNSGWDYTELFEMMAEKELSFSDVKKICLLSDGYLEAIKNKKPLSIEEENRIIEYFNIKCDTFYKKEYYFGYPTEGEGYKDKVEAQKLFWRLKEKGFKIFVDGNKYKLMGIVDGKEYVKEGKFDYDSSAIIVLSSYVLN